MQVSQGESFSEEARRRAQQILSRSPYKQSPPGKTHAPLAGILHWIGQLLKDSFDPIGRWIQRTFFHPVSSGFNSVFGRFASVALVVVAIAIGVGLAILLARRRSRVSSAGKEDFLSIESDDPEQLERQALRSEADGDFETALRLRFRAGLLMLEKKGLIFDRQVETNHQVSVQLSSPSFDYLALRHELVVYARYKATAQDSADSLNKWPEVLSEARHLKDAGVTTGALKDETGQL